jgi:hypothetical protein
MTLDEIPTEIVDMGEPVQAFCLETIRASVTELVGLTSTTWLAIQVDGIIVEYGMYSFLKSDVGGYNAYVTCVFRGTGTGGVLREMRHTYFAPDEEPDARGYVFYLDINATILALTHLKKYFD